jgi:acetoin utilization protein AcuA
MYMAEEINFETRSGRVTLHAPASTDQIRQLNFDPQFSENTGFGSLENRKKTLLRRVAEEDARVVLAVNDEKEKVIGYSVLAHPPADQRWARINSNAVMEAEAVEVTRNWRRFGVGKALLEWTLCHPGIEEKIIYLVGYVWTWDLEGAKMSAPQYRKMIIDLFQPFDFTERVTNEANICLNPNNLFMCRIGKNVNGRLLQDFKWLLFGIYPS